MRTQTIRTIAGGVNADGTLSRPGNYTVRRTGVGVYSLTFPLDFRPAGITVTPASQPYYLGAITASANTFTINILTSGGSAADAAFWFSAAGAA